MVRRADQRTIAMTRRTVIYFLTTGALFCTLLMSFVQVYQQLVKKHSLHTVCSQRNLDFLHLQKQNALDRKDDQLTSAALDIDLLGFMPVNTLKAKPAFKVILMWNAWTPLLSDAPLVKGRCPVKACVFTADMSLLHQSDVIVLHFGTLEDYPVNRKPYQRIVFYHFESASPDNTDYTLMEDPRFRYNYFNWTMTYRRDSDIFLRDYYGSVVPKTFTNDPSFKPSKEIRVNHNWITAPGEPATQADIEIDFAPLIKGKTKLVAWFVDHCTTLIRPEEYVRQLSQYVAVDKYGKCAEQQCPYNCDEMLRKEYKFYLAFENSWCPDYVTEKFIRPFLYDAVAIVLGGANYSHFAPEGSYINARDFKSPKELADYLLVLNRTNYLYARYFDWKKNYDVYVPDLNGWCELCRMAHDETLPSKVYPDIKEWWKDGQGGCENNASKFF